MKERVIRIFFARDSAHGCDFAASVLIHYIASLFPSLRKLLSLNISLFPPKSISASIAGIFNGLSIPFIRPQTVAAMQTHVSLLGLHSSLPLALPGLWGRPAATLPQYCAAWNHPNPTVQRLSLLPASFLAAGLQQMGGTRRMASSVQALAASPKPTPPPPIGTSHLSNTAFSSIYLDR